jgi:predicted regulator of Ras-like GTPase activity (Roadblock/LC7/MglB family)
MTHVSDNEALRLNRLIFYEKDVHHINELIEHFRNKTKCTACIIIDIEGHCIAKSGEYKVNPEAVSALVAGAFASTKEVAKLFGDHIFTELMHVGTHNIIQITSVGRVIQMTVFPSSVKTGMIGIFARELAGSLSTVIQSMEKKNLQSTERPMDAAFTAEAQDRLDKIFDL